MVQKELNYGREQVQQKKKIEKNSHKSNFSLQLQNNINNINHSKDCEQV